MPERRKPEKPEQKQTRRSGYDPSASDRRDQDFAVHQPPRFGLDDDPYLLASDMSPANKEETREKMKPTSVHRRPMIPIGDGWPDVPKPIPLANNAQVRGRPELHKMVTNILDLIAPHLRDRGLEITEGVNEPVIGALQRSGLDPQRDYQWSNLLGATDVATNNKVSLNPGLDLRQQTQNGETMLEVLIHELTHASGHDEQDAQSATLPIRRHHNDNLRPNPPEMNRRFAR